MSNQITSHRINNILKIIHKVIIQLMKFQCFTIVAYFSFLDQKLLLLILIDCIMKRETKMKDISFSFLQGESWHMK